MLSVAIYHYHIITFLGIYALSNDEISEGMVHKRTTQSEKLTFIDANKVSAVSLRPGSMVENLSVVAVHKTITFV